MLVHGARLSGLGACLIALTALTCACNRTSPVEKGCEPAIVTADSVAMRVWPMACEPVRPASLRREATLSGSPTPLKISIDWPWLRTVAAGTLSISHLRATSPSPFVLRMA